MVRCSQTLFQNVCFSRPRDLRSCPSPLCLPNPMFPYHNGKSHSCGEGASGLGRGRAVTSCLWSPRSGTPQNQERGLARAARRPRAQSASRRQGALSAKLCSRSPSPPEPRGRVRWGPAGKGGAREAWAGPAPATSESLRCRTGRCRRFRGGGDPSRPRDRAWTAVCTFVKVVLLFLNMFLVGSSKV